MKTYAIERVFHAELDNLIFDIKSLSALLEHIGKGLFCPRDSIHRGIASLVYVNDVSRLEYMNNWFRNNHKLVKNDMELLGYMLMHEEGFYSLPIESSFGKPSMVNWTYIDKDKVQGVFDAAAMGQYLFGVDPDNISGPLYNGFVNENALIDLKALNFKFEKKSNVLFVKYEANQGWVRCYNLHIHSKVFKKLARFYWFLKVIEASNQERRSLISHNIVNWRIFYRVKQKLRIYIEHMVN